MNSSTISSLLTPLLSAMPGWPRSGSCARSGVVDLGRDAGRERVWL
jgi:hypothetical protein